MKTYKIQIFTMNYTILVGNTVILVRYISKSIYCFNQNIFLFYKLHLLRT